MTWMTASLVTYLLCNPLTSATSCTPSLHACSSQSSWTSPVNACIEGHDEVVTHDVANIDACKELCRQQTEFTCLSIEFKHGECHQSTFGQFTRSTVYKQPCPADGWLYSERLQESDTCRQVWKPTIDASIRGHNDITVYNVTSLQECKSLCINEMSFPCRSVEYLDDKRCFISRHSQDTVDSGDFTQPNYLQSNAILHAERADLGHWSKTVYACITGNDDRSFTDIADMEGCKDKCLLEQSFLCLSVDYFDYEGLCRLSKSRRDILPTSGEYRQPCSDRGWKHADRFWWN